MSNATHTPGPWATMRHFDAPNTYCPFITVGPATIRFTQGYDVATDPERKARAEADARLIAETPYMAAALRNAGDFPWVHNAAHTTDIEALRRICLAYSEWWNGAALPILARIEGAGA